MIVCKAVSSIEDPELQEQIWLEYKDAFAPLKEITGQDQECYPKDKFLEMLTDADYVKFILRDDEKLIGFGTLSANLEKAAKQAYANPTRIRKELSAQYPDNSIFYFPALLLSRPYRKRKEIWFALIGPMFRYVDSKNGVAVFDFSIMANPKLGENLLFVAQTLQKTEKTKTNHAEFVEFDRQVYGAIKLF